MKRNYLQDQAGDQLNALLAGSGFNLRKIMRVFFWLIFGWSEPALQMVLPLQRLGLLTAQKNRFVQRRLINVFSSGARTNVLIVRLRKPEREMSEANGGEKCNTGRQSESQAST
jgi:hypothetical protein